MIVAHLSELHLGFRAYDRSDRGRNVRERDVAAAFERAVQELGRLRPELVVVVGDVFDRADPPPSALVSLTRGLDALRSTLPDTPVVLTAGARDTPLRPGDAVALSVLESFPGIAVATGTVHALKPAPDLHVCLVPYRAGLREPFPTPEPDARARWNVLVAYGAEGRGADGVPFDPGAWSYVALGGSHTHRTLAPNVVYAGALERVGSSPWDEAAEEKGFVTVDLASGRTVFHPLPVRPVVALAPVRTPPAGARGLPDRVREVTREVPGGLDDKIVRLGVRAARPTDLLVLQGDLLADLSARALHLDVEAEGDGPSDPLPRARDLLARRLAASGAAPDMEGPAWAEAEVRPPAAMRVDLDRDDPLLGRVELRLPGGIVAVVSDDPSATHRLLELLAGAEEGDLPPWLDPGSMRPEELVVLQVDLLAEQQGTGPLEAALASMSGPPGGLPVAAELGEVERRLGELDDAEAELSRLESELRELRADHAEVAGDLEEATMAWLRERQDAETHLQTYRDRARELRSELAGIEGAGPDAPCPTCGRLLRDHYDAVLAELRGEWESIVQDGSWWRRRREQLELKPGALRELEGTALRLQASVEENAERVEGARSRVREKDELRQRAAELASGGRPGAAGAGGGGEEDVPAELADALSEVVGEVRRAVRERLLERASRYVGPITGSRVLALTERAGALRLEGPGAVLPPADEETAAAEVGLRLAGAALVAEAAGGVDGLLVPAPLVERLREEDRLRLLDLLPELGHLVRHVVVGMHASTAERRREALDGVLEVRPGRPDGPSFRWLAAGPSRVRMVAHSPG